MKGVGMRNRSKFDGWCTRFSLAAKLGVLVIVLAMGFALVACGSGSTTGGAGAPAKQSFAIEGKWKNTGSGQFGQMQPGAIITFDGKNCNVYSPNDTYAFYTENGQYRLDVTGLLGGTPSFTVTVIDNDHISMTTGASDTVELTRVG